MSTPVTLVNVPNDVRGSPGDMPGMIAIESDQLGATLFYCVKNYDGVSPIWAKSGTLEWIQLAAPPAPVITSSSSSGDTATPQFPIITGTTVSGIPLLGPHVHVSIRITNNSTGQIIGGGPAVVNNTTWRYQPPLPLAMGSHTVTAYAIYYAGSRENQKSKISPASSPITVNVPLLPPTLSITIRNASKGGTGKISWATSNATFVSIDGEQTALTGTRSYNATRFDPPVVTKTVTISATGPGGTTTKQATVSYGYSGGK